MNKKLVYFLSLGITLILPGVLYAKDSPDRVAWVTHQDQTIGFTMEVPKDWLIQDLEHMSIYMHRGVSHRVDAYIHFRPLGSDSNLATSVSDKVLNELMMPGYKKTKRTLDGISAIQVDGIFKKIPKGHMRDIYVKENGKNLEINCMVKNAAIWEEYIPIFERMLTSLKFLSAGHE